ncbi:MAG: hypothetical protein V1729_00770 [Candidatus Woesearchaeota archaeon]
MTISNSDAGVALIHPNGTILDAIGWGDPAGISAGLWEGTPATAVIAGNSLKRTDSDTDTDDNIADFAESIPDFKNSAWTVPPSTEQGPEITFEVSVSNNAPSVDSLIITGDEDNSTSGIQILPVPEGQKSVPITVQVSDPDGTASISSVTAKITGPAGPSIHNTIIFTKIQDINSTTAEYAATIMMEFYDSPGEYNITITAQDQSSNTTSSAAIEYLSMAAIAVDVSALKFEGASLGGTTQITGDFALSTADAPTVRNVGNTHLDIGIYGTDLVDGTNSIGIGNIRYTFDNDFGSSLAGAISKTIQTKAIGLANEQDSVVSLGFQLFVPMTTSEGNYTGNITVVAVSS